MYFLISDRSYGLSGSADLSKFCSNSVDHVVLEPKVSTYTLKTLGLKDLELKT